MKTTHGTSVVAAALVGALALSSGCTQPAPASPPKTDAPTAVSAQQVPLPKTAADVPGPASGNAMTKEYVQMVGRMAYVWGWPLVNSHNRRAGFAYVTSQNGNVPGWNGGVLPMAPVGQNSMLTDYIKPEQTFVACPNQDVVYGAAFATLDKQQVGPRGIPHLVRGSSDRSEVAQLEAALLPAGHDVRPARQARDSLHHQSLHRPA